MVTNLLAINPVAFHLGPIPVNWYGIIIGVGILIAYFLAQKNRSAVGWIRNFSPTCSFGQFRSLSCQPVYITL